jgi:hypothetical protein
VSLDRDLAQVVAHLNDAQRLQMAKRLARWSRQLRAEALSKADTGRRETLPRLSLRRMALN